MTGDYIERKVLPIGGLKEKVIAAHRAGIDTVLFPMENQRDTERYPRMFGKIDMIPLHQCNQVMKHALTRFQNLKIVKPENNKSRNYQLNKLRMKHSFHRTVEWLVKVARKILLSPF